MNIVMIFIGYFTDIQENEEIQNMKTGTINARRGWNIK